MKKQIAIEIIAFLLILLFIYAALNKLSDYQKFVVQLGQSPVLTGLGPYIGWMVIAVELVIASLLAFPLTRIAGFYASFSLMVMFTAYITVILNFSGYIPCSCGGVLEKLGWNEHLIFNCIFVLLSLTGVLLESDRRNESSQANYRI